MSPGDRRPIGVFDSGIGGLSVLAALRAELPAEDFVYFADTGHAPYGERGADYVVERTRAVAAGLIEGERIKLKLVPLGRVWREAGRDGKALAAVALYEGLRREGRIGEGPREVEGEPEEVAKGG